MDIISREQLEAQDRGELFISDADLMSISFANYIEFVKEVTHLALQNKDYKFRTETRVIRDGVSGGLISWEKR